MARKATISSEIARSQAGQRLYGRDWIGRLDDADFQLVREYGPRRAVYRVDGQMLYREIVPRCESNLASKVDRAIGRHHRADLQAARVYFWLLSRGFDCSQNDEFDRASFEAALLMATPFEIGRAMPEPPDPQEMSRPMPRARPPRKRGRRGVKGALVKARMIADLDARELTLAELKDNTKRALGRRYSCSPNWADEMRKRVLFDYRGELLTKRYFVTKLASA
jgi:hypothetical protein